MKKKTKKTRKVAKATSPVSSYRKSRRLERENDEKQKLLMRQANERHQVCIKSAHDRCLHLAGSSSLSDSHSDLTAIVWHYYNDKIWRGICLVCQRLFVPEDKDYQYWIDRPCLNYASKSHDDSKRGGIKFLPSSPINTFPPTGPVDPNSWSDEELKQRLAVVRLARAAEKELELSKYTVIY